MLQLECRVLVSVRHVWMPSFFCTLLYDLHQYKFKTIFNVHLSKHFSLYMMEDTYPSFQQTIDIAFTCTASSPKMIHNRPYPLQQSPVSWFLDNIRKKL